MQTVARWELSCHLSQVCFGPFSPVRNRISLTAALLWNESYSRRRDYMHFSAGYRCLDLLRIAATPEYPPHSRPAKYQFVPRYAICLVVLT